MHFSLVLAHATCSVFIEKDILHSLVYIVGITGWNTQAFTLSYRSFIYFIELRFNHLLPWWLILISLIVPLLQDVKWDVVEQLGCPVNLVLVNLLTQNPHSLELFGHELWSYTRQLQDWLSLDLLITLVRIIVQGSALNIFKTVKIMILCIQIIFNASVCWHLVQLFILAVNIPIFVLLDHTRPHSLIAISVPG